MISNVRKTILMIIKLNNDNNDPLWMVLAPLQRCLSCPAQTEGRDKNIGSDVHQPMCFFNCSHLRISGYLRISGILGVSQYIRIMEYLRISEYLRILYVNYPSVSPALLTLH